MFRRVTLSLCVLAAILPLTGCPGERNREEFDPPSMREAVSIGTVESRMDVLQAWVFGEGTARNVGLEAPSPDDSAPSGGAGTAGEPTVDSPPTAAPARFGIGVRIPTLSFGRVREGNDAIIMAPVAENPSEGNRPLPSPADIGATGRVPGRVFSVAPPGAPDERFSHVEVRTIGEAAALEDEMPVAVWVAAERVENAVIVPVDSIKWGDGEAFVYVVDRQSMEARLRPVTLGIQGFGDQQILSGIEAGELIVLRGRADLTDGNPVLLPPVVPPPAS